MKPIYLDYNATTPVDQDVANEMIPYITEYFGNPSSSHSFGLTTRLAIEKAREQVAAMIQCEPYEVFFTGGGTESNNMAIQGAAYAHRDQGKHIIISAVEHPAVAEVALYLQQHGFEVSVADVDGTGRVNPLTIEKLIRPDTILISVMHANNEVGTIQPVKEIAAIAHRHRVLMHSDAAQSVGKIPVNVADLGVDLLSIAGHKLYA
ncbi:MAG: cysteine desulfurase family protein, partial [Lentimicrobiaceae bacterium]